MWLPTLDRCFLSVKLALGAFVLVSTAQDVAAQDITSRQEDPQRNGRLQINVNDDRRNPLPCRIHLQDAQGRNWYAPGQPKWDDHFVCEGRVLIELPAGAYTFAIEKGLEYEREQGIVRIRADKETTLQASLGRIANLRSGRWFAADLHVHRPLQEIELLMRAEDIDFAPVITWWNNRNLWQGKTLPETLTRRLADTGLEEARLINVMAGEDEREGGALMYYGLPRPLQITGAAREFPSPMKFLSDARKLEPNVWVDAEKPFWWDVPVWVASGQIGSIGIAHNHMCRSSVLPNEAWGKPRDVERFAGPHGNGRWTQQIYYHLLNSGIRLPPSAGSASGVLSNPVGYNRVYVNVPASQTLTESTFFAALGQGNSFVTNGPLLVVRADGTLPGSRLTLADAQSRRVRLDIALTSVDRVRQIEVIRNGEVAATIPCDDSVNQQHSIEFEIGGAGWFLVRAVTEVPETFRFGSTAPWYYASPGVPTHISRESAQFFLDWTTERIQRVEAALTDPVELRQVLEPHHRAEGFWRSKVESATAP